MTDTDTDPVLAEIERLRELVARSTARIAELQKLRSRPYVAPVLVYWRHYRQERETYEPLPRDQRTPLEGAYRLLEGMADVNACSPDGVEVNGVLIPIDDLRERWDDDISTDAARWTP